MQKKAHTVKNYFYSRKTVDKQSIFLMKKVII